MGSAMQGLLPEQYDKRFGANVAFRERMWQVLCKDFFQKYIPFDSVVLDMAAGFCEFSNGITARKKIAVDLNISMKKYAKDDVETIIANVINLKMINDKSVNIVFISNLLEHLSKEEIIACLREAKRVLVPGGKLLIMQPNYKFSSAIYYDFFDHITPLSDKSLVEVVELCGFNVTECYPQFLPWSTKSKLPKSIFLLKLYLKMPFVWRWFGKQAFLVAVKNV